MADVVERLRYYASQMRPSGLGGPGHALSPAQAPLLDKAADEITRYRNGLKKISEHLSEARDGDASFIVEALLAE